MVDYTLLLGPGGLKGSGQGFALDLLATAMKSPRVARPGWWLLLARRGALGSSAPLLASWRSGLKSGCYRLLRQTCQRLLCHW